MKTIIKNYIKQLVLNEMAMMKAIDQRKTALMIYKTDKEFYLFLYRPNFFYELDQYTKQLKDFNKISPERFLINSLYPDAMIYQKDAEKFVGPIAGLIAAELTTSIYEVQFSRAEPGTGAGPMMYEIAMSIAGNLTADRESVTNEASNVWKKFYERTDIIHKPLPKKLQTWKDNTQPWLDCSFKLSKGVGQDIKILQSVHNMAIDSYSQITGLSKQEIEDLLKRVLLTRYNLD